METLFSGATLDLAIIMLKMHKNVRLYNVVVQNSYINDSGAAVHEASQNP